MRGVERLCQNNGVSQNGAAGTQATWTGGPSQAREQERTSQMRYNSSFLIPSALIFQSSSLSRESSRLVTSRILGGARPELATRNIAIRAGLASAHIQTPA